MSTQPRQIVKTVKEEWEIVDEKREQADLAFRKSSGPVDIQSGENEEQLFSREKSIRDKESQGTSPGTLPGTSPTAISLYEVSPPPFDDVTQAMHIASPKYSRSVCGSGGTALGYNTAADRAFNRRAALQALYGSSPARQNIYKALSQFRTAAKLGCSASLVDLAVSDIFGIAVRRDLRLADHRLQYAARLGSVEALEIRALCYMSGIFDGQRKYALAHQYLQNGMRRFSASCMLWEAFCYEVGLGVRPDPQRAQETYRASAVSNELTESLPSAYPGALSAGNPWMLLKMALFFMHVSGGQGWYNCGMKCLECAAALGLPDAQLYFGMCCLHGRRAHRSVSQAAFWLHWAAKASPPHEVAKELLKEIE